MLSQYAGQKIFVHAISPSGGNNNLIANSGAYQIPGQYAMSTARASSVLWPAEAVLDNDPNSCYSSQGLGNNNPNSDFLAVWLVKQEIVNTLKLTARMQDGVALAFPYVYDIHVTSADNSQWVHVGTFTNQPDANGNVNINLPQVYKTYGVLITPRDLGADDFGNNYIQMCGVQFAN